MIGRERRIVRVGPWTATGFAAIGLILFVLPTPSLSDPLSDRQVLAVFTQGTVSMPDSAHSGDVAQVIEAESGLSQILASFSIQQIERAFPEFDRADTVGIAYTGETVRLTDWSKVWLLTLPQGLSPDSLVAALLVDPTTVIAEPNGSGIGFSAPKYPDDPYFKDASQWGLWTPPQSGATVADVRAAWAWGDTTGTPGLRIGILDGGIKLGGHADLASRLVLSNGETEFSGHAYRVAGIAGAATNNGVGIAGVDWNAGIVSRIGLHKASDKTTIDAITFLSINFPGFGQCRVINASGGLITSSGAPRYSLLVEGAFKEHFMKNGVVICAVGNRGVGGARDYPANFQHGVISVGAIDQSNSRWSESSTSPSLDLAAPGVGIWTTDSTGAYAQATGTSYAAPFVAGAASLLFTRMNKLRSGDVEHILRLTADDILPANGPPTNTNDPQTPFDSLTGAGRLNIARALNLLDPPNEVLVINKENIPYSDLVVASDGGFGPSTVFGVPDLPDGTYGNISRSKVSYDFNYAAHDLSFSSLPMVWGVGGNRETTGWIRYGGSTRLLTDYRHCWVTNPTLTGFRLNTYIYHIPNATDRQWFPAGPDDLFKFAFTVVRVAPVPDAGNSFYVPQRGSIGTPFEGTAATSFFRGCPNNDGGTSYPDNARIKIVVKNSVGQGIPGIQAADVFVLLNGGTPMQDFVGYGADSVIANSTYNQTPLCPDVRAIYADAPTDESGVTYITFKGATPGSPGVATRDPARKWGHFDTQLPVYVLGVPLQGRLTSTSGPGSYTLQIKSYDFTYIGLTTAQDLGEMITNSEWAYMSNNINATPSSNPLAWWADFNSNGLVDGSDFNLVFQHLHHDCHMPLSP